MTLTAMDLTALSVCGVAWLVTAATLVLDLLGRLPDRLRRTRVQRVAGLAMITSVILTQVGELTGWPRPERMSLDLLTMAFALIFLVSVLAAASPRRRADSRPGA